MLTFRGSHCSSQVRNQHHDEIIPAGLVGTQGVFVDSLFVRRTHLIQYILNYTYPTYKRETFPNRTTWYYFIMTYTIKNLFTIHNNIEIADYNNDLSYTLYVLVNICKCTCGFDYHIIPFFVTFETEIQ